MEAVTPLISSLPLYFNTQTQKHLRAEIKLELHISDLIL